MESAQLKESMGRSFAKYLAAHAFALIIISIVPLATITQWWTALGGWRWPAGLAASLLAVGLAARVFGWRRRIHRYHYPRIAFRFEVLSSKVTYWVPDCGPLVYSRRVTVRARQNDLDEYLELYPLDARFQPVAGENVVSVEPIDNRLGERKCFRVLFERPLRKGEVYTFEIVWRSVGEGVPLLPFLSASTDEPTRSLEFEVRIPKAYLARMRAVGRVQRSAESLVAFDASVIQADGDGRFGWRIDKPPLYYHYLLHWFLNEPAVAARSDREPNGDLRLRSA
jgi:hypothetical protein